MIIFIYKYILFTIINVRLVLMIIIIILLSILAYSIGIYYMVININLLFLQKKCSRNIFIDNIIEIYWREHFLAHSP